MTDRIQRERIPPKEGLRRQAPFRLRATADLPENDDGLTLDGYGAVFNSPTLIDSWEGRFHETIANGSMKKSFRESPPRMQYDHGYHPVIGSIPIGSVLTCQEEVDPELAPEGGAHIVARLYDNWLVQPVRDAIAGESINGMSFRFGVVREKWTDANGKTITDSGELADLLFASWWENLPEEELLTRTLLELRVPEMGPVMWPAYDTTSVGVRSVTIDLGNLSDPKQRAKLANAVMMADRAEAHQREQQDDTAPRTTNPAGTHPAQSDATPRTTGTTPAGTHGAKRPIDEVLARTQAIVDHLPKPLQEKRR